MGEDNKRTLDSGGRRSSSDSSTPLIKNENQGKGGCISCLLTCCSYLLTCCGCPQKTTVRYKMLVCGQTFDAHLQLLNQIQTPDLNLMNGNDEESCITIVFCPVVSRPGTDAEAAMRKVPDGVPVILVLMHHSQEPKQSFFSKVLSSNSNVVLEVNIFYHKSLKGILLCEQNEEAAKELKKKLMNHHIKHSGSNNKYQGEDYSIL